jgi:hypothetical protein
VNRNQLADAARGRGAGIGGGLHGADVAAHEHGDVARANVLLGHERDVGRLHHRVGGLDRPDETSGFDEAQCVTSHARLLCQTSGGGADPARDAGTVAYCGSAHNCASINDLLGFEELAAGHARGPRRARAWGIC